MHIFLTGPSGFVGARVLEDLHSAGHTITALAHSRRSVSELQRIAPGCTIVFGDVSDPFEMRGIVPAGVDAIIYLPGLLRENKKKRLTFQRVHVEGVRNLLDEAKRVGCPRWIHMSALGVGPDRTEKYFATKWRAEELVRSSGLAWTVVRPSYVFDDRPTSRMNFVSELANVIKPSPLVAVPGDGEYRGQPVSLDDVSQTIVQSLTKPDTIGETYLLGGPEQLTYNEIMSAIAKAMHLDRTLLHIPLGLMMTFAEILGSFQFFPITAEQLEMLTEGNVVRNPVEEAKWQRAFELPMKRFQPSIERAFAARP